MERNTVVCADALEWLRSLPAGSVDAFWSSPEYNLDDPFRSGGNASRRERDSYAYLTLDAVREQERHGGGQWR